MGAGKTSVGRRLAQRLSSSFFDSDNEIEIAAGMSISEIFLKFGERYFRAGEERVIERLLSNESSVIATGGGAFMSEEIQRLIKESAVSIWIKADLETLWTRVQGKPSRPLLMVKEPKLELKKLIDKRYPIYEKADITIESPKSVAHIAMVMEIIQALKKIDILRALDG